jgi:hypothetical protein
VSEDNRSSETEAVASEKLGEKSATKELVKAEDRSVGVVSLRTWKSYIQSSGTILVGIVCVLFVAGQVRARGSALLIQSRRGVRV